MVKTKVKSFGLSDPGKMRRNNEDNFYLDPDRGIFLVVDGIGGQAAGEEAAKIAVECVRERLSRQIGNAEQRVREAIAIANKEILQQARVHPEWRGMACVLTMAVLENGEAVIGHVGDSRLYLVRQGKIRKITHDHSPVGEREESGELTEEEAMRHPRRNEVFRDVGSEEHAPDDQDFIEIQHLQFDAESAMLLCSDGLSDQVGSQEIRATVERYAGHPERAVRELIAAANRSGGKDNVTVMIVEGEQFVPPPATEPQSAGTAVAAQPSTLRRIFTSKGAFLVYGIAIACALAFYTRTFWVPAPVIVRPRVLTVGQNAPFSTIASAMAAAHPGDTVDVLPGDYPEQVQLRSGVTVRSRVPLEAVLRGVQGSTGPAVLAQGVKDARIAGFQIIGDPHSPLSPAVLLVNAPVEVEDLEISGAAVGIEIQGGNPRVVGNSVHDCAAAGIRVKGDAAPWISHNSLQRNKGAGIAARAGSRPALLDNVFEKNPADLPPDVPEKRDFFIGVPAPRAPAAPAAHPRDDTPHLREEPGKKK